MGSFVHALVLLSWSVLFHVEATEEKLSPLDASFCQGGLKVFYPELDVDKCLIVPKPLRKKISTVWGAPDILFSAAHKNKRYVLMMVDPDAPSRANLTPGSWRHWLVADIQGESLRKRQINGTTLEDYRRPTPPFNTSFHRYQFLLFKQPANAKVTLTEKEKAHRGKWNVVEFQNRLGLGAPVAKLQYLTQYYKD